MTTRLPGLLISAALFSLLPAVAMAHTGAGATHGVLQGFGHPMSGLDHVAAMVLVGILGGQMGGAARWLLPSTFVLVMAAGGAVGMAGFALPLVELGIAASIILLGMMIASSWRGSMPLAAAAVGAGAIFHGYAHGMEMPASVAGLDYGLGFLSATALLHLGGLGVGLLLARLEKPAGVPILRTAGGLAALLGLGILTGAV